MYAISISISVDSGTNLSHALHARRRCAGMPRLLPQGDHLYTYIYIYIYLHIHIYISNLDIYLNPIYLTHCTRDDVILTYLAFYHKVTISIHICIYIYIYFYVCTLYLYLYLWIRRPINLTHCTRDDVVLAYLGLKG